MLELCSFFPIEILFCNPISLLLQTLHGWIRDYRLHWYDAFLCSRREWMALLDVLLQWLRLTSLEQ